MFHNSTLTVVAAGRNPYLTSEPNLGVTTRIRQGITFRALRSSSYIYAWRSSLISCCCIDRNDLVEYCENRGRLKDPADGRRQAHHKEQMQDHAKVLLG